MLGLAFEATAGGRKEKCIVWYRLIDYIEMLTEKTVVILIKIRRRRLVRSSRVRFVRRANSSITPQ
jgi:hypothetical protein